MVSNFYSDLSTECRAAYDTIQLKPPFSHEDPLLLSLLLYHNHCTHSALSFLNFRFRHEYRLERKLLNEQSADSERVLTDNEEASNIVATSSSCQRSSRHRISRVVVLHKDRLETFFNPVQTFSLPEQPVSGESFDNDSFWSGSLTWY